MIRNLDMYAEKEFAKKLLEMGQVPYYPFKDKGIDILTMKGNTAYKYQLKARNLKDQNHDYWFTIRKRDLKKYLKEKNMFYVFCAVLPDTHFDFFIIPIKMVYWWFKEYTKECETKLDPFFRIKPVSKGKYKVEPKRIKLDINKYKI